MQEIIPIYNVTCCITNIKRWAILSMRTWRYSKTCRSRLTSKRTSSDKFFTWSEASHCGAVRCYRTDHWNYPDYFDFEFQNNKLTILAHVSCITKLIRRAILSTCCRCLTGFSSTMDRFLTDSRTSQGFAIIVWEAINLNNNS